MVNQRNNTNFQKQYKIMEIFKNTCKALNRILLSTGQQKTFQTASFRRILSMAIVSSKAFCEVTTKLRQTGELSGGQIILDDGSVFMIHKTLLATGSQSQQVVCQHFERPSGTRSKPGCSRH